MLGVADRQGDRVGRVDLARGRVARQQGRLFGHRADRDVERGAGEIGRASCRERVWVWEGEGAFGVLGARRRDNRERAQIGNRLGPYPAALVAVVEQKPAYELAT